VIALIIGVRLIAGLPILSDVSVSRSFRSSFLGELLPALASALFSALLFSALFSIDIEHKFLVFSSSASLAYSDFCHQP
jgi:hypothetical protein